MEDRSEVKHSNGSPNGSDDPLQVVIIGAGIMGLCTAYYLLCSPNFSCSSSSLSTVTIIENSNGVIAPGASSYAGGFIAGGSPDTPWHDSASQSLALTSWQCYLDLVDKLDGRTRFGWRECGAVGLRVGGGNSVRSAYRKLPNGTKQEEEEETSERVDWLNGEREDMTGRGGTAQLDPKQFCQTLYDECVRLGLKTLYGETVAIERPPSTSKVPQNLIVQLHDKVASSEFSSSKETITVPCTRLVIAAGPWSAALCQRLNLPDIPMTNLPGHSILIRPALHMLNESKESDNIQSSNVQLVKALPAEAVFAGIAGAVMGVHAATSGKARGLTDEELSLGYTRAPELFTRSNGLVYVAGENSIPTSVVAGDDKKNIKVASDSIKGVLPNRLPSSAEGVPKLLDKKLIQRLINSAIAVSPALDPANGAVIEAEQFCYRPVTSDGEPIIEEIAPCVYLATGHGPWGITLAPGTGKVVSELVRGMTGSELSADVHLLGLSRGI